MKTLKDLPRPEVIREEDITRKFGRRFFSRWFKMPDGREEEFTMMGANVAPVIGMPVTESGSVILVRQFRYGDNEFVFEFPGGNPKGEQSPEDALRAEIDEEIGYSCGCITRLGGQMSFDPASYAVRFTPYLITGCVYRHEPHLDKNEILEVIELPLDEFLGEIRDGLYVDAKTAAITLLALPRLGYQFVRS